MAEKKSIVLGQYVDGNSYLYRLDPRVKIMSTVVLMIAVFFLDSGNRLFAIYEVLAALLLVIILIISGRISIIKALKGLRPLLMLSLFILFFQIFFNRTGNVIRQYNMNFSLSSIITVILLTVGFILTYRYIKFKFLYLLLYLALVFLSLYYLVSPEVYFEYTIKIYDQGLLTSIFVFIRLIVIVLLSTILTLTTKPTDLTLGIERLLRPLSVIKINPEEIALIITIALRYIPTILEEAYKIMDAQASRGADFMSGSLSSRVKILISLLVPMFVMSFEKSDELADAMLARNFVPGQKKTKYHRLSWKPSDTFALVLSNIILGACICLKIFL